MTRVVGIHSKYPRTGKGTCASALVARGWNQVDFADALRRAVARAIPNGWLTSVSDVDYAGCMPYESVSEGVWRDECKSWDLDHDSDALVAAHVAAEFGAEVGHRFATWLRDEERTLRQVLQYFGTEIGRARDPDHWVKEWLRPTLGVVSSNRRWRYDRLDGKLEEEPTRAFPGGVVASDVRFDNEAQAIRSLGGVVVELVAPWAKPPSDGIAGHASDAGISPELVDLRIGVPAMDDSRGYEGWARELRGNFIFHLKEFERERERGDAA
jgi:hypothetical protein